MSLITTLGLTLPAAMSAGASSNARVPDKVAIGEAAKLWNSTRRTLAANIVLLKQAVSDACAAAGPDAVSAVQRSMSKFDVILERLDGGLAASLERAQAAGTESATRAQLSLSKEQLIVCMTFVKSDPLIAQLDGNPFGVDVQARKSLSDSFARIARAIGTVVGS